MAYTPATKLMPLSTLMGMKLEQKEREKREQA